MNLKGEKGFIVTFLLLVVIALAIIVGYFTFYNSGGAVNNSEDEAQQDTNNDDSQSDTDNSELEGPETLLALLEEQENMTQILSKIEDADFDFESDSVYTFFLPVDDSFNPDDISNNPADIADFIEQYALEGAIFSDDILNKLSENDTTDLAGNVVSFTEENGQLFFNGVAIVELEQTAKNAVLYKIEGE